MTCRGRRLVAGIVVTLLGSVWVAALDSVRGEPPSMLAEADGTWPLDRGLEGPLDSPATALERATRVRPPNRRIVIAFVGDIHTLRPVNYSALQPGGGWDYSPMFAEVAPLLGRFDSAVCHMEAPIAPRSTSVIVAPPLLSAAAPLADALAGAGFDRCSTAGNHIMDRGVAGVDATLQEFDRVGITQSGTARTAAEAAPAAQIYPVEGISVAHLSYSWAIGGQGIPASQPWRANRLSTPRVIDDARAARAAGAEIVVVSFTWGIDTIVPPTPYQRSVADAVTASGAVDLIVGQQAHVVQPIELVNGVWVIYGMGNFLSGHPLGWFPITSGDAAVFTVGFEVGRDGSVLVEQPVVYPTLIDKTEGYVVRPVQQRFDPRLTAQQRAALTRSLERTRALLGPYVAADS